MFERLKNKWNIKSNVQLVIILLVFTITGSLSLKVTKPILDFIGINPQRFDELFLGNIVYFIIRVIVLFPIYQILLIIIGSLFFQHTFFKNFVLKTMKKMKLISKLYR